MSDSTDKRMKYYIYMDIIGTIVFIAIIIAGITSVYIGNLIVGWIWIICGTGILGIAAYDIWRRYK